MTELKNNWDDYLKKFYLKFYFVLIQLYLYSLWIGPAEGPAQVPGLLKIILEMSITKFIKLN